jgi:hydroxymethylpyrimidine pyrophosphatase-like HAD family hydrolase
VRIVKELIVFDLDGTLAESKSPLDAEMSAHGRSSKNNCCPIFPTTNAW